ncbi:MAG: hypothetical protein JXN60_05490 [Lentisphaerae bacterium]|nr:hypothetical protein [Lentisphaerota bacterium]
MNSYGGIRLGYCPVGKFVFDHEDAKSYSMMIEAKMDEMGIEFVNVEPVVQDVLIRDYNDIEPVVKYLSSQHIDGLFIPHCNFGTEGAAARIARDLGKPVLLWGPRDGAPKPDGTRYRDTFCGMLATSKVLGKLNVPFTYIENCSLKDTPFEQGLDRFIRTLNVVKQVKGVRIGIVGNRIDFFWSTIVDESDLLRKFGIEILPIDLATVIQETKKRVNQNRKDYEYRTNEWKQQIDITKTSDEGFLYVLALQDYLYEWAKSNSLKAIAVEAFPAFTEQFGAMINFAGCLLPDRGIHWAAESDIHGAVSCIIASAAMMNKPVFLADITVRHPDNDNSLLIWHADAPWSMKHPDCKAKINTHWILPGGQGGMTHFRLREGEATLIRFDGENGKYSIFAEHCETINGPYTQNTYCWVKVRNFLSLERKLIYGPYIHHAAFIYGDCCKVIQESCRYLQPLEFDK